MRCIPAPILLHVGLLLRVSQTLSGKAGGRKNKVRNFKQDSMEEEGRRVHVSFQNEAGNVANSQLGRMHQLMSCVSWIPARYDTVHWRPVSLLGLLVIEVNLCHLL